MNVSYSKVIRFWFVELESKDWFSKDPALDLRIAQRFRKLHAAASRCELHSWRCNPEGRLAEILVLDQFSRNIYRDTPRAFATDALALALAQEAHHSESAASLDSRKKPFIYMPFMHSESQAVHAEAASLFATIPELNGHLDYEIRHKSIIDRFGRYPHRNKILARKSTQEELDFLAVPGSSF